MVWSEWEWLTLLIALLVILITASSMSWTNNSNPNYRHQRLQQQHQRAVPPSAAPLPSPTTTVAHPAATSSSRLSPSMNLSLPATPDAVSFSSPADENHFIATLLQQAHSSLAQDKPMHALSLVLAAVRQQRGEEGVFDVLNETREGYGLKAHANPIRQQREMQQQQRIEADDEDMGMASLSLRSTGPVLLHQHQQARTLQLTNGGGGYHDTDMMDDVSEDEGEEDGDEDDGVEGDGSILDEAGHGDVVDEAVQGGTHVVCRACGGVISRERMQAHVELWCEANEDAQSHEDG